MYKTEQEEFWAGDFGDEYIDRNKSIYSLASRTMHFASIFKNIIGKGKSLIEFGSNIGMNLLAIKRLCPDMKFGAIEINKKAIEVLRKNMDDTTLIYQGSILEYNVEKKYDIVLICSVLIHINPSELQNVYQKLYDCSSKYIIISEYYNPTPVEVTYRGYSGRLFKRDFAGEMLDKFPDLELVDYGFSYHRDGFSEDDLMWFILKKN